MDEFTSELARFTDNSSIETLNIYEEFANLNQTIQAKDRNVQVGVLRQKWQKVFAKISQAMNNEAKLLTGLGGALQTNVVHFTQLNELDKPPSEIGELLNAPHVYVYNVSREHYQSTAAVAYVPIAVGMDIHLYAAGYFAPLTEVHKAGKRLAWSKIAVIDEGEAVVSDQSLSVITDALKAKLAFEMRSLRQR